MCAILAIVSSDRDVIVDAITLTRTMNNRGEQGCGAAADNGKTIRRHHGVGLVRDVFGPRDEKRWSKLTGPAVIMHALYSTIDPAEGQARQPKVKHPLVFSFHGKRGALVHNGNLPMSGLIGLRKQAEKDGYIFKSETSDSEIFCAMLSTSKKNDFLEALVDVLQTLENKGSFSLAILFKGKIIGVRCGIRPLCIGKKHGKNGENNSYILASESCVFPTLEATKMIREVEHGELVVFGPDGQERSIKWGTRKRPGFCLCEFLYFAKPSTKFFGVTVARFRFVSGQVMAENHPAKADAVVPVPNSGRHYSEGFASVSGLPTKEGFEKNYYGPSSRSFMEERGTDRSSGMRQKLTAIDGELEGLSVVTTEDTLIRGSVCPYAVKSAREWGLAREVHERICSQHCCFPCHIGADIRRSNELPASTMTTQQINEKIVHADSLEYLIRDEQEEVIRRVNLDPADFCMGCFTGEYPVPPPVEEV